MSDNLVPDVTMVWERLHAEHPRSGWWPLLLAPDIGLRSFGPEQDVAVDAARFLAERWESQVGDYIDPAFVDDPAQVIPYKTWPGLAPAGPPGADPDQVAAWHATCTEMRDGAISDPFSHLDLDPDTLVPNPFVGASGSALLGLVESPDSAGAISASGWEHELAGGPGCTAVLRSWEERFGVRLCALECDSLWVTVGRPVPMNEIELPRRVAVEHVAFCPDIPGEIDFQDYADGLIGATVWRFWWD